MIFRAGQWYRKTDKLCNFFQQILGISVTADARLYLDRHRQDSASLALILLKWLHTIQLNIAKEVYNLKDAF